MSFGVGDWLKKLTGQENDRLPYGVHPISTETFKKLASRGSTAPIIYKGAERDKMWPELENAGSVNLYPPRLSDCPVQAAAEISGLYFDFCPESKQCMPFDDFKMAYANRFAELCDSGKINVLEDSKPVSDNDAWADRTNAILPYYSDLFNVSFRLYWHNNDVVLEVKKNN
jgi:hypothetical protein